MNRCRGSGSARDDHDDHLVGVGHDDPLHRIGVVGRTAQHGGPGRHPDHAGQRARRPGGVPGQRDPVTDHHATRPSSRARIAVTVRSPTKTPYLPRSTAATKPSTASSCAGLRRVRGREPRPGRTRTSSSSRSLPGGQGPRSSIDAHSSVKPGKVLPTVAAFATSIPGTARPSTAAAITSRWSS